MVHKPGLEPEPGLGLWQALNSGLAQDFQSPSPPKPGPSQGFEPEPGPIHHYLYLHVYITFYCRLPTHTFSLYCTCTILCTHSLCSWMYAWLPFPPLISTLISTLGIQHTLNAISPLFCTWRMTQSLKSPEWPELYFKYEIFKCVSSTKCCLIALIDLKHG